MYQIKVFGLLCYASTLQNHRTKLACRERKDASLGYVAGFKGPVFLDLHSQEKWLFMNTYYPTLSKIYMLLIIRSTFVTCKTSQILTYLFHLCSH